MKRRALLQSALGLPVIGAIGDGLTQSGETEATAGTRALRSGLAGLDYAMGGVAPSELVCITSPPHSGKTVVLLDWTARICHRYRKNVVFYSANEPSFGIARKSVAKGRAPIFFTGETLRLDRFDRDIGSSGAIILVDAHSADLGQAQSLASWLQLNHSAGCAALVSDGWCTTQRKSLEARIIDGVVTLPAERWDPTFLRAEKLSEAAEFALDSGLPVVMGVQTASLVDDDALADSLHLSLQLRQSAHRWLAMVRPELYVDTDRVVSADKNVVHLCGRGANWSDTRRSRLRFDDRQRVFETVA